jgi:hypothetical protein
MFAGAQDSKLFKCARALLWGAGIGGTATLARL